MFEARTLTCYVSVDFTSPAALLTVNLPLWGVGEGLNGSEDIEKIITIAQNLREFSTDTEPSD